MYALYSYMQYLRYRLNERRYKKMLESGLPGPKPFPVIGNLRNILGHVSHSFMNVKKIACMLVKNYIILKFKY